MQSSDEKSSHVGETKHVQSMLHSHTSININN